MGNSIEDEIWEEFNGLSGNNDSITYTDIAQSFGASFGEKIPTISRIDKPQNIWIPNRQIAQDELIDKAILGEKKWDQVVMDLPKRLIYEYHEPEFRKLNKMLLEKKELEKDLHLL